MPKQFFYLPFSLTFFISSQAQAANCDSLGTGNWNTTATWECFNGFPPVSIGNQVPGVNDYANIKIGHTITVDVDVAVETLQFQGGILHAGNHNFTLSDSQGIRFPSGGTFNADTSTVKLTDADHYFYYNTTFYNLQWATPLTAPRTLTIDNNSTISINGTLNIDGTPTSPVTLAGTTGNFISLVTVNNCAGKSVSMTNVICKPPQTITFNSLPNKTFGDVPFDLGASASSGLAVSYAAAGNCTVAGITVTITGAGTCTITASQAGDASYSAATDVVQAFNIGSTGKNDQTVTFAPSATATVGTPITLSATVTSGLSVTFASTTPTICTVSGTTLTPVSAGICTVTVDQAGDATYNAATQVSENITISDGGGGSTSYVPPPPPPETKVIVAFGGDGKGKVTSNPSGIDCQSPYACNYTFKTNTSIQLTPIAGSNSRFQNWGNSCNDGMISASGRTVYCMVYFVDMTPPPVVEVEPEPVVEPEPIVEPEPVITPEPEPVVEPEPVITPEQEPIVEPAPVVEPELPPTDDTTEPVAEPVIEEPPVVEEPVDMTPEPEPDVMPEPVEILPPVNDESCPPKDSLSYYCNAGGQTIGDLNIVENPEATNGVGFLSNAVIIGTVQLADKTWISNLHVTKTGIVIGGTVTGLNHNAGYMGDFVFKGEFIKGGKLGGKILNLSKIFSWFEDVALTANAHLIGGALKGKIKGDPKNPALLENLRILSGSVVSGVIIGNGVKIDKDVEIEESIQDDTPADEVELPILDEQFSAGIGVNDSSYQTRNVAQILSDAVSIRGKMHVNQKHVGQKVKIFVTVAYRLSEDSDEEFLFTINQLNGLMPWDEKKSSLSENPFREETLQTFHSVRIYDGILLATGVVNIQFGYLLENGTIVQSPEGIALTTVD